MFRFVGRSITVMYSDMEKYTVLMILIISFYFFIFCDICSRCFVRIFCLLIGLYFLYM
jgi:hypothetical protein